MAKAEFYNFSCFKHVVIAELAPSYLVFWRLAAFVAGFLRDNFTFARVVTDVVVNRNVSCERYTKNACLSASQRKLQLEACGGGRIICGMTRTGGRWSKAVCAFRASHGKEAEITS